MRTDDLDTAANEQGDEEKVKEVSQSDPQRESKLERVGHNAKLPACDSVKLDVSAKAVVASLCRGCPTPRTLWLQLTPKQNAGCRSCESSSGIAVDVQQR